MSSERGHAWHLGRTYPDARADAKICPTPRHDGERGHRITMRRSRTNSLVVAAAAVAGAVLGSCSERPTEEACYFDDSDDADKYAIPMAWKDWCDYPDDPLRLPPFVEEHCPASECIATFWTCDEVPLDQDCQQCPAVELDAKVNAAFQVHQREHPVCTDGRPREIIDSERGCMFESEGDGVKYCCYTGVFTLEPCGS